MAQSVDVAGRPPPTVARRTFGSWAVAGFLTITTLLFVAIVIAGSISLAIWPRTELVPRLIHGGALAGILSYAWLVLVLGAYVWAPIALGGLVLGWLVARRIGRARAVLIAIAVTLTTAVWPLSNERDPLALVVYLAAGLAIGVALPLPGEGLEDLAGPWRGIIVGFPMGLIWIVGTLASAGVAIWHIRRGRTAEAGWTMCAASFLPALLMSTDLPRADAPATSYLVAAVLLAVFIAGVVAILIGNRAQAAGVAD